MIGGEEKAMAVQAGSGKIEVLDPRGDSPRVKVQMAPRPESLRGVRVGLLDNSKINAGRLLGFVADLLQRDVDVKELISLCKADATRPAPADLLDELVARCDVAIVAVGD